MMSQSSLILLFLLYNAYYLKSLTRLSIVNLVKRGATVRTQFWVIPKIHFFSKFKINNNNNNNNNKIKAGNVKKAGRKIKLQFLEEIQGLIVPYYA